MFAYDKITLKLKLLTKEDKTLITNVWESKKYRPKQSSKEFPNKIWSMRGVEFKSNYEQWGPLNEHPVVDVRARRALLRTVTLWGTLDRARRINPRHTASLDRSHESSEYLKQIIGDDFFCSLLL